MTDDRGQKLFGTLISSKPAKSRSPMELAISVALHAVAIVLLALFSRSYVPRIAQRLLENITIVIPAEDPQVTIQTPTKADVQRALPAVKRSIAEPPRAGAPGISLTPGPIPNTIPEPTAGPETVEPGDNGGGNGANTLSEKLRPSKIDPRLLGGSVYTTPGDMSPAAAVRARISQSIQEYNDSVLAEAEARERATNWTVKGKDGKEWGFSPGKIHLGDITLPFPLAFQTPPGRRDEVNAFNRSYAEIEAMANREIGRQSFNERVKAIRERKEKERAEKKKVESPPITN